MISEVALAPQGNEERRERHDLFVTLVVILLLFGITGYVNAMPLGTPEDDADALFAEVWDHRDEAAVAEDVAAMDALLDLSNAAVEDAQLPPGGRAYLTVPSDSPDLLAADQTVAPEVAEPASPESSPTPTVRETPAPGAPWEANLGAEIGADASRSAPSPSDGGSDARPAPTQVRGSRSDVPAAPAASSAPQPIEMPFPAEPTLPPVEPVPTLDVGAPVFDATPTLAVSSPAVATSKVPPDATTATATSIPTATSEPTKEPTATRTPRPTRASTATSTPTATSTATPPPTPTYPPIVLPTVTGPPGNPSCSTSAGVCVTGVIRATRVLVVNDRGDLLQVWSNGDAPIELQVRLNSLSGPAGTLNEAVQASYGRIASTIPLGARGLVYQR